MQTPTRYELAINLKTAKALSLDRAAIASRQRQRGDRIKPEHPAGPPMTLGNMCGLCVILKDAGGFCQL